MELPDNVQAVQRIKRLGAVEGFPQLQGWNVEKPLLPHQEVGILWMLTVERGVVADQMGLGKSIESFGLITLLRQLGHPYRTLIICDSNVHQQWVDECVVFTDLDIVKASGTPAERQQIYNQQWDICVSTYPLLRRDFNQLAELHPDLVVFDESGYFRHHNIITHQLAVNLTVGVPRVILLDGTPIQNSLLDIHGQMEALHLNVFGSVLAFGNRYIEWKTVMVKRGKRYYDEQVVDKFKNVAEFKKLVSPYILRRTREQVSSSIPDVFPIDVWLDLLPAQRKVYESLRKKTLKTKGLNIKEGFHLFQYAVDHTGALGEKPGASTKVDWIINKLKGDIGSEKVVIFSMYKEVLKEVRNALESEGYICASFTGDDPTRDDSIESFRTGNTQILLGTQAIERGVNLQASSYMICLDELGNAARMIQLAGRIARLGSQHSKVFVVFLRTNDTHEKRRWEKLNKLASLPDHIFNETNDVYAGLSEADLYNFIRD
jgi:SNF2 family DNA or RNA helicase